jgi:hypothetical protein
MSRHTIKRKRGYGHLVLGWDRPLKHFFCQVWSKRGNVTGSYVVYDVETLEITAEQYHGIIPDGLLGQILLESEGLAETNTCKDWR